MGSVLNLLTRIMQITTIIDAGKKIYSLVTPKRLKPELKPTPTDLILEAIDIADRAAYDMETVILTLKSLIPDDGDTKTHPMDKLKMVLVKYGFDPNKWDQLLEWYQRAEFGWTSFRDELKILVADGMSEQQKKDIVTYKPRDKTKVKVKLSD